MHWPLQTHLPRQLRASRSVRRWSPLHGVQHQQVRALPWGSLFADIARLTLSATCRHTCLQCGQPGTLAAPLSRCSTRRCGLLLCASDSGQPCADCLSPAGAGDSSMRPVCAPCPSRTRWAGLAAAASGVPCITAPDAVELETGHCWWRASCAPWPTTHGAWPVSRTFPLCCCTHVARLQVPASRGHAHAHAQAGDLPPPPASSGRCMNERERGRERERKGGAGVGVGKPDAAA